MRQLGLLVLTVASSAVALLMLGGPSAARGVECKFSGEDGAPNSKEEWRVFFLHKDAELYREADVNCDGEIKNDELGKYTAEHEANITLALHDVERLAAAGSPVKVNAKGETVPPVLGTLQPSDDPCPPGWNFLLRDSFEDVSIFSCPKSFKDAAGAQFGWTRNGVSDNELLSARGVVSVGYAARLPKPDDPFAPYIVGYGFAPAISFNRERNSADSRKSKDVDILSFSATSEIGVGRVLGGTQYFRFRPAINTSWTGDPHSWSLTAEWQPLYNSPGNGINISSANGLGPLTWELDPIARLIYSRRLGNDDSPIFADSDTAIRLGPVLALTVAPQQDDAVVPAWLQRASFFTTYEWLYDLNSGSDYSLFSSGLNFALDKDGHTAIKLSYLHGDTEETGEFTDQVKAGLTARW
jgi:hypothetical protein